MNTRALVNYVEAAVGAMTSDETEEWAAEMFRIINGNLTEEQIHALLERSLSDDIKAECAAAWGDE